MLDEGSTRGLGHGVTPNSYRRRRLKKDKNRSITRMLDISFELFSSRYFDDVSLKEISDLSGCSTQTIYQIYRGKEELFRSLFAPVMRDFMIPKHWLDVCDCRNGLTSLLTFTEMRIRQNSDSHHAGLIRTLSARFDLFSPEDQELFVRTRATLLGLIKNQITRCIEEGLLRPIDPEAIVYVMESGAFYDGFVHCALQRADVDADFVRNTIRKIFASLVTEAGDEQVQDYVKGIDLRGSVLFHAE